MNINFAKNVNEKKCAYCLFCRKKVDFDFSMNTFGSIDFNTDKKDLSVPYYYVHNRVPDFEIECECGYVMDIISSELSNLMDAMMNSNIFNKLLVDSTLYSGGIVGRHVYNTPGKTLGGNEYNCPYISLAVAKDDIERAEGIINTAINRCGANIVICKIPHNNAQYFEDKDNGTYSQDKDYISSYHLNLCFDKVVPMLNGDYRIENGEIILSSDVYDKVMKVFTEFKDILAEIIEEDNKTSE